MHIRIAKISTVLMTLSIILSLVYMAMWDLPMLTFSAMSLLSFSIILMICLVIDVIGTTIERRKYRD